MSGPTPATYKAMRAALRPKTTIQVWCVWCETFLHEKDGHGVSGRSDAICPACLEFHFPEVAPVRLGSREEQDLLASKHSSERAEGWSMRLERLLGTEGAV